MDVLTPSPRGGTGGWLIFSDRKGVATQLAARLQARGDPYILVFPGEEYTWRAVNQCVIRLEAPGDYQRLSVEGCRRMGGPWQGVLHLWSLDTTDPEATTPELLELDLRRSCGSVLFLIQALAGRGPSPRLWLVTCGSQAVAGGYTSVAAAAAPLLGLARVIGLEHPDLRCTCVDLDPKGPADRVGLLLEELEASDHEEQVAYRAGQRYVARLKYASLDRSSHPLAQVCPDASYLITGGLGAIGLELARWLTRRGARHLVLAGRQTSRPPAVRVIRELESAGASLRVIQADVSHAAEVTRLLADGPKGMPPLRGLFHLAGTMSNGLLFRQTWEQFASVLAAKVHGAWNLHAQTRDVPLDHFVLFSSATSLLGLPGAGNYAAGNAFLDALAHHRRSLGLPGLSINWGAWAGLGMAQTDNEALERSWQAHGIQGLPPERALEVLERLLGEVQPQLAVLAAEWSCWRGLFPSGATPRFLEELLEDSGRRTNPLVAGELKEGLERVPPDERAEVIHAWIQDAAARILGAKTPIDVRQPLRELGLDSLGALELRNLLSLGLGRPLPATLVFNYPTIRSLAAHLADPAPDAEARPNGAGVPEQSEGNEVVERVVRMSEEEAEALLLRKLDALERKNAE